MAATAFAGSAFALLAGFAASFSADSDFFALAIASLLCCPETIVRKAGRPTTLAVVAVEEAAEAAHRFLLLEADPTPTEWTLRCLRQADRVLVIADACGPMEPGATEALLDPARDVTEALLALTPSALSELRDRGLLAYHLNDLPAALRDLQTYLKLSSMGDSDEETKEERKQIWEHVKALRRRVASLN